MKMDVLHSRIEDVEDEVIVVNLFEGVEAPGGATGAVDKATDGYITRLIRNKEFSGKQNEISLFPTFGKIKAKKVCVVGLGKAKEFGVERVRDAAGKAAVFIRDSGSKSFSTIVHGGGIGSLDIEEAGKATAEGTLLALYQHSRYRTIDLEKIKNITKVAIVEADEGKMKPIKEGIKRAKIISEAVFLARDLVNSPGCDKTPTILAETAKKIARENGLHCEIYDAPKLKKMGFGAMLGVALGSDEPCKFIILEHNRGRNLPTIVIIGKGITFDSGGISIKPSDGMDKMKYDMSGAAAVIATMQAVANLKIPLHVVALAPATENLPSGHALKPGDILKSHSGKTIEVISTDAEGRLILADALSFAKTYKPKAVIDLATLTGACVIALGNQTMGLFGTDEKLKEKIKKAAEKTSEKVWELPLWKEYYGQIESDIADMKNTGGRPAGSITGAAFLSKFIEDIPWVHLDMAGTAWSEKDKSSLQQNYIPKGGTGIGVRLLVQFLEDWKN